MENIDLAVQYAAQQCREYTKQYGVEYGIALRDGAEVFKVAGHSTGISCNHHQEMLLMHDCDTFVHSHPVESCLSIEDILSADHFKLNIFAVTPRGDLYRANNLKDSYVLLHLRQEACKLFRRIKYCADANNEDIDKANHLMCHFAWEEAHRRGYITYETMLCQETRSDLGLVKSLAYAVCTAAEADVLFKHLV